MYYLTSKDKKTGTQFYYKKTIASGVFHIVLDIEEAKALTRQQINKLLKDETIYMKFNSLYRRKLCKRR